MRRVSLTQKGGAFMEVPEREVAEGFAEDVHRAQTLINQIHREDNSCCGQSWALPTQEIGSGVDRAF